VTAVRSGFDLNNLQLGWLLCDGRGLATADYPELSAALGQAFGGDGDGDFNLPDLRGMFLRGVDGGAGADPDAANRTAQGNNANAGDAVGSRQADQFANHTHPLGPGVGFKNTGDYAVFQQGTADGSTTGVTGGSETRPKNVYVYYLIFAGGQSAPRPPKRRGRS
jgi:phage-related tail fiber protein